MTAGERGEIIRLLEQSQAEFLAAIDDLTAEQWGACPAPGRWSIGEIAEHVMLAEGSLMARVRQALAAPANADWLEQTGRKSAFLQQVMPRRNRKAVAPEWITPQGLARDEVINRYRVDRAETLRFAQKTELPLHEFTTDHPFPVFGTLNAYQWLLYIPLHNLRHNQQIAEVMEGLRR